MTSQIPAGGPLKDLAGSRKQHLRAFAGWLFASDLDRLARIHHTDKASTHHAFTRYYCRHLPPRRKVTRLLEIGIGGTESTHRYETREGGQSLRVWQAYFPKAQVVGVDIYKKDVSGPRIVAEQGSQDDPEFLSGLLDRYGPFDVIIDDGSHIGRHQTISLHSLFRGLRVGGVYVIEDLATAYSDAWEGGPPGTGNTSASLLKEGIDAVLRKYWAAGDALPIREMHVYDEIAFLVRDRD